MSEIGEIINSLEVRLSRLLSKIKDLQQFNVDLLKKIEELEQTRQIQEEEINDLKSNLNSLKITNSLLGSDEYKRDTKLKINSLIKEIDYCITQLSDYKHNE